MVQSIARMLGCWFDKVERLHINLSIQINALPLNKNIDKVCLLEALV
jgi:hypothetical protein